MAHSYTPLLSYMIYLISELFTYTVCMNLFKSLAPVGSINFIIVVVTMVNVI